MRKYILLLVVLVLVIGVVPRIGPTEAQQPQFIMVPLAPRYTYNPSSNNFSEQRYNISDACAGGGPNHPEHNGNALYAVDFGGNLLKGTPIYAPVSGGWHRIWSFDENPRGWLPWGRSSALASSFVKIFCDRRACQ